MKNRRYFLVIYLTISLAFVSVACGGITIHIGQPSEEISPNSDAQETTLSESNTVQEILPPGGETSPSSGAPDTTLPEPNTVQEDLPNLIDLEAAWAAGTLDLANIPDISVLLENEWALSTNLTAVVPKIPANLFPTDITGIDIRPAFGWDIVVSWYDYGGRASGSSQDLGEMCTPENKRCEKSYYILPPNKSPNDVIDIAVPNLKHTFYYFKDGTVSVGDSVDAEKFTALKPFSLPPGKYPGDIVGIASTCSQSLNEAVVYAWYKDGTVSSGTYLALDAYRNPYEYTLPPGKTIELINSIGIACSDDHVYVWYWDGTVSSGMSNDLGMYRDPVPFITP